MRAEERTELDRLRKELDDARARIDSLERQLAESRAVLAHVFEVTGDMLFFKDRDSVYRIVNDAFCDALGKRQDEILGKTDHDLFPAADADAYVDSDREVMRSRQAEIRDWEAPGKAGKLWLHARKIPVQDDSGEVTGVVCSVRDISRGKRAELEFERLFNLVPDMVASSNSEGYFTKLNAAWEATLGYTPNELLSIPYADLIHPEDRENTLREVQRILSGRISRSFVNRYRAKDGSWRWLEWNTNYFSGDTLYSVARDITDRIRQEKATRLWADAFRFCSHGIAIGLPVTNAIMTCNEAFARMHGRSVAQIEGTSILSVYHPEDREAIGAHIRDADRTGFARYEARMVSNDGTVFPVQMDIVVVFDEDGSVLYRIATVQDISSRLISRRALEESEARFRSVVESAPQGIFIQCEERFAYLNPASLEVFGASSEEQLVGRQIFDIVPIENRALVAERIQGLNVQRKAAPPLEYQLLHIDGTPFDAEVSAVPFIYSGKRGALVFVRDITSRKAAEKERAALERQLVQTQKIESIGRLAGGVAHDLNNLLTPILGYAEMLLARYPGEEKLGQYLKIMLDAAVKSRNLLKQLLVFSSSQPIEFSVIDLNAVVRGFEQLVRRTIRANIAISYRLHEEELPILGEPGQIEQIIMNLSVNAEDAMPDGGNLEISTSMETVPEGHAALFEGLAPGRYAVLSMADTGSGMDEETLSHLFEPFYTTKPKGKGTGLGLSTVYGIVRQHGGVINVASSPGAGSRFSVWFPLRNVAVDPPDVVDSGGDERSHTGTILVAEDDPMVRKFVVQALAGKGFTVCDAPGGEEALELVQSGECRPELLLTDVVMRGMNGRELYLKMVQEMPHVKVIYMSGYTRNLITMSSQANGGAAFLQKPFSIQTLVEKVVEVMTQKKC